MVAKPRGRGKRDLCLPCAADQELGSSLNITFCGGGGGRSREVFERQD